MTDGPRVAIALLAEREAWMRGLVAPLTEAELREPTILPGWTRAHVVVHLARNADSHRRRVEGAARGEVVDQYPGGVEGRAREIEAGVQRDARAIVDDAIAASEALDAAWLTVDPPHWDRESRDVGGQLRALRELPTRRLGEVEVHAVDLGTGATPDDWSSEFVELFLPNLRAQTPELVTDPALGDRAELWKRYRPNVF